MSAEVMDRCICSECGEESCHHWKTSHNTDNSPHPYRNKCHKCGNELRFEDIIPEKASVYYKIATKTYMPEEVETYMGEE